MQTAILLGLVYAFAWSMDNIAGSSFMDRPIVCGALTGLVMGNFEQGLVIGGTLELVWMGFISYAGIINGETRIGAILGTYFALATGNSFDVAISIAMPIAILGGNVSNAYNIVVSYLMPVSYTHLDVYKRQDQSICSPGWHGRYLLDHPYTRIHQKCSNAHC